MELSDVKERIRQEDSRWAECSFPESIGPFEVALICDACKNTIWLEKLLIEFEKMVPPPPSKKSLFVCGKVAVSGWFGIE